MGWTSYIEYSECFKYARLPQVRKWSGKNSPRSGKVGELFGVSKN